MYDLICEHLGVTESFELPGKLMACLLDDAQRVALFDRIAAHGDFKGVLNMIACKTYCASTVADYEALYVALQAAGYQPARSLLTTAQCGNECRWYFYIFVDGSFFWMDMAESDVSKGTRHSATPWQDGDPL